MLCIRISDPSRNRSTALITTPHLPRRARSTLMTPKRSQKHLLINNWRLLQQTASLCDVRSPCSHAAMATARLPRRLVPHLPVAGAPTDEEGSEKLTIIFLRESGAGGKGSPPELYGSLSVLLSRLHIEGVLNQVLPVCTWVSSHCAGMHVQPIVGWETLFAAHRRPCSWLSSSTSPRVDEQL